MKWKNINLKEREFSPKSVLIFLLVVLAISIPINLFLTEAIFRFVLIIDLVALLMLGYSYLMHELERKAKAKEIQKQHTIFKITFNINYKWFFETIAIGLFISLISFNIFYREYLIGTISIQSLIILLQFFLAFAFFLIFANIFISITYEKTIFLSLLLGLIGYMLFFLSLSLIYIFIIDSLGIESIELFMFSLSLIAFGCLFVSYSFNKDITKQQILITFIVFLVSIISFLVIIMLPETSLYDPSLIKLPSNPLFLFFFNGTLFFLSLIIFTLLFYLLNYRTFKNEEYKQKKVFLTTSLISMSIIDAFFLIFSFIMLF